ncbi:MAG: protein TolQ [Hellea sp.]|nr:protein TolQ [Hellea sp.]
MISALNIWLATNLDFSPLALFSRADLVVQLVLILLIIASIWSWAIAIDKLITFRLLKNRADKFEETFWSGRTLEELSSGLANDVRDPMARIFSAAMKEWEDSKGFASRSDGAAATAMRRIDGVMNLVLNRELAKSDRGMTILGTIGSTSLFAGLLGTVWGIITSFRAISESGNANFEVVAPGVAEALFLTAVGLICAIPAVIFYNIFANAQDKYAGRLEGYADELSAILSRKLSKGA